MSTIMFYMLALFEVVVMYLLYLEADTLGRNLGICDAYTELRMRLFSENIGSLWKDESFWDDAEQAAGGVLVFLAAGVIYAVLWYFWREGHQTTITMLGLFGFFPAALFANEVIWQCVYAEWRRIPNIRAGSREVS